MKKNFLFILLLISTYSYSQTIQFDNNWRFHLGGAQSAETPDFDDSNWRILDLPHDWSIENLPGTESPFSPTAVSQVSGGFTTGGTGWYRKSFYVSESEKGKCISIIFDGVYMNADFWLNGEHIGKHPYGYTGFWFDITGKVKFGANNIFAVQVKNEGLNSRWYSGSGIYRHVWLKITEPVHIETNGIYIVTPEVNNNSAVVNIKTSISNHSNAKSNLKLVTRIFDTDSKEVGTSESKLLVETSAKNEISQTIKINKPVFWSLENPYLYTAVSEVYSDNKPSDKTETKFGIRTITFTTENGFALNGKTIKLKGGCVHHDNGPLGAKAYDRAEERRVELLKESGFNAIRCSHNPPSPAFLDACDRLGMLVIDEAFDMWRIENNPYDYHLYFDEWWQKDIESMITRDRNHPSVILWSIGNEIRGMETPEVIAVAGMLGDYIRKNEPTRPVIAAVNSLRPEKDPFFATLDIGGYNYATGGDHLKGSIYPIDHARVPNRIMVGTESYPLEAFGAWMDVLDYNYLIGDFVWTAFDYIGEASIGWRGYWQENNFYPWNLAFCGDIDICGWKRPQSFYRDALWKENQVSVFVEPAEPSFPLNPKRQSWSKWHWRDVVADWNWTGYENRKFNVHVYSSCESVELFLNGKSLGRKNTDRAAQFTAMWEVPYQPGELKAVGYIGDKSVTQSVLQTSGKTEKIKISPDRKEIKANGQDLSYITIELTDRNGIKNPKDDRMIHFKIEGEGTIAGVGNANPMSIESYQLPRRKTWLGRCLVIIKSNEKSGQIKLIASAEGLEPVNVIIQSK